MMLHVLNIYPYLCQKYNYELVQKGVDKIIKTEEQIAVEQAANLLVKQEANKISY